MEKILIIVDMQNDFIGGSLGSADAQAIVPHVVKKIYEFDGKTIICTADTHHDDYLSTQEGKNLPITHCIEGSFGWKLNDEVGIALDKADRQGRLFGSVCKNTFGSKDLPKIIYDLMSLHEIKEAELEIELIGLDTDICVISNALLLKAFFPEAKMKIDSKCCAGTSKAAHSAALKVAKSCQIEVI